MYTQYEVDELEMNLKCTKKSSQAKEREDLWLHAHRVQTNGYRQLGENTPHVIQSVFITNMANDPKVNISETIAASRHIYVSVSAVY